MGLKVIHISPAYLPAQAYGGPTMSVSILCETLQTTALQVLVFTTRANGLEELPIPNSKTVMVANVPVRYFKRLTKDHTHFSPTLFIHLLKHIKKSKKEKQCLIVHIHSWWNLVAVICCMIAKATGIEVLVSPRGMLTGYSFNHKHVFLKRHLHRLIGKKLMKSCHIHATSNKEKRDILGIVKPKSITVIPNFVRFPEIQSSSSRSLQDADLHSHSPFKLLFLSRVDPKKGLEILFQSIAILKADCRLSIAGTGDTDYIEQLKALSEKLKITHQIVWLGQLDEENKFISLKNHDLLILPSYNENFANVVIESLAMGTAVLLSDQVGLADYVKEKDLGWIFPLNVRQLARQLEEIIRNSLKLQQIRIQGPIHIAADFYHQDLLNQYLNLYNNLIPNLASYG